MNLNKYEVIYVLKPDLSESSNLMLVNYYKSLILKNGGKNILVQHKGRRHLSYNVFQYYDGIYVQFVFEGNGFLIKTIEKSMRFDDNVLRYLTVRKS